MIIIAEKYDYSITLKNGIKIKKVLLFESWLNIDTCIIVAYCFRVVSN